MLHFDPEKRIDIKDILDHEFFDIKKRSIGRNLRNTSLHNGGTFVSTYTLKL
jgi:hypothetical protein